MPFTPPTDLWELPAAVLSSGLLDAPPLEATTKNPHAAAFAGAVRPIVEALADLAAADRPRDPAAERPKGRCTFAAWTPGPVSTPVFSFENPPWFEYGREPKPIGHDLFGMNGELGLQGISLKVVPSDYHHPGLRVGLALPRWTNNLRHEVSVGTECNYFVIMPDGETFVEHKSISTPSVRDIFDINSGRTSPEELASNRGSGSTTSMAGCNQQLGFPLATLVLASVAPQLPEFIQGVTQYLAARPA